jgi:hypothetical protein
MHQTQNYTHSANAVLRLSTFSLSKFVVGSSRANIPQFALKVSARAIRIIREARTYETKSTHSHCDLLGCDTIFMVNFNLKTEAARPSEM